MFKLMKLWLCRRWRPYTSADVDNAVQSASERVRHYEAREREIINSRIEELNRRSSRLAVDRGRRLMKIGKVGERLKADLKPKDNLVRK